MTKNVRNIVFFVLVFTCLQQSVICLKQIQLILKFEDAINLQTTSFIQPQCETEVKISQTLNQLDEWVRITQSTDSLQQYKQTLIDLADTIQQSQRYVEQKDNQTQLTDSVSEIQMNNGNSNVDLTLDELTERLSRIENIQTYLDTLQEEGFQDYNDYGKVLNSLRSFIQDIDNLENVQDELSQNRFKLIQKADEVQQIYNKCYPEEIKDTFSEQESGSTILIDNAEDEFSIQGQTESITNQSLSQDDVPKNELNYQDQDDQNLEVFDQEDIQMLSDGIQEQIQQEKEEKEVSQELEQIEIIADQISDQDQESEEQEEKVLLQAQIRDPHLRQLKKAKYQRK
ncbi:transmembrane protein, putative (macronuclear) [Tetrahymena thermophila SB210]|uniref:Transmembrane protein, putative n=1 Tax=Tetrahymena thermophila (strain SB210) TaxID=312017 RepID=I7M7J2_TETTS|nr:transmembrane protein, putative [Tetrahymena thermophila SB210]EAR93831.1 transmembrane protein, putative [Tetrahymena thermophila SB210]|eukprot:XP_001014076.1 transmembrane protein, putative [Tetrahymena thermophila SB210]